MTVYCAVRVGGGGGVDGGSNGAGGGGGGGETAGRCWDLIAASSAATALTCVHIMLLVLLTPGHMYQLPPCCSLMAFTARCSLQAYSSCPANSFAVVVQGGNGMRW
jgi:hypothetical protein